MRRVHTSNPEGTVGASSGADRIPAATVPGVGRRTAGRSAAAIGGQAKAGQRRSVPAAGGVAPAAVLSLPSLSGVPASVKLSGGAPFGNALNIAQSLLDAGLLREDDYDLEAGIVNSITRGLIRVVNRCPVGTYFDHTLRYFDLAFAWSEDLAELISVDSSMGHSYRVSRDGLGGFAMALRTEDSVQFATVGPAILALEKEAEGLGYACLGSLCQGLYAATATAVTPEWVRDYIEMDTDGLEDGDIQERRAWSDVVTLDDYDAIVPRAATEAASRWGEKDSRYRRVLREYYRPEIISAIQWPYEWMPEAVTIAREIERLMCNQEELPEPLRADCRRCGVQHIRTSFIGEHDVHPDIALVVQWSDEEPTMRILDDWREMHWQNCDLTDTCWLHPFDARMTTAGDIREESSPARAAWALQFTVRLMALCDQLLAALDGQPAKEESLRIRVTTRGTLLHTFTHEGLGEEDSEQAARLVAGLGGL